MDKETLLLSVHIPKTGGTSFRRILRNLFGEGYVEDYDWLKDRPAWMKNGLGGLAQGDREHAVRDVRCIHGHFKPQKYAALREISDRPVHFVTWLRDPVERAVSMYHYLRGLNTPQARRQPWEQQARELDLLGYFQKTKFGWDAQSRQLQGFALEQFSFIGIMERYSESIELFLRAFGSEKVIDIPHELQNPRRSGDQYEIDEELRDLLIAQNTQDYALYQAGCEMFEHALQNSRRQASEAPIE